MNKYVQLGVPIILALLASQIVEARHWDEFRTGTIVALSVIAGAVFVRLARGMPITNMEYFEINEIEELSYAVKDVMRRMIQLLYFCLIGIFLTTFISLILKAIAKIPFIDQTQAEYVNSIVTGCVVVFIAFTFMRAIVLVRGDYDLVELQAELMTRFVKKKRADEIKKNIEDSDRKRPYKTPDSYGKFRDKS
ncbi:hypothetical protein [Hwanghaeella sp. LZ110]|uniref:hypothetical protein n=1 Tax=Hwanghaeella sp. LZ110 TaxID=3402810 RepID=UPI003B677993